MCRQAEATFLMSLWPSDRTSAGFAVVHRTIGFEYNRNDWLQFTGKPLIASDVFGGKVSQDAVRYQAVDVLRRGIPGLHMRNMS